MPTQDKEEEVPVRGSKRSEDLDHRIDSVSFQRDEVICRCGEVFTQEGFVIHRIPYNQGTH